MQPIMIRLLQRITLLTEIKKDDKIYITWLKISLQDSLKTSYPLRTKPYTMLEFSRYRNVCTIKQAKFKYYQFSFLMI